MNRCWRSSGWKCVSALLENVASSALHYLDGLLGIGERLVVARVRIDVLDFHPKDNNQADALAILALAQHIEGLTVPGQEAA